ncbi:MAG: molybdopterin dehydrogenase, partial [Planctomycetota bacterium]
MKNFEYAAPRSVEEAVQLLAEPGRESVVLAGGTDLVGLMRTMVVQPDRVVYLGHIRGLDRIQVDEEGNAWVGAMVCLRDFWSDNRMDVYPALKQVIQDISSIQLQYQGTLVGDLLQRPRCWFFRNGHGLLAQDGRLVREGDNRYHAILGHAGPAKFVHASRLAPAAIALGAFARVVGPRPRDEQFIPVEQLFRTPENEQQRENTLVPGQLVTHI